MGKIILISLWLEVEQKQLKCILPSYAKQSSKERAKIYGKKAG